MSAVALGVITGVAGLGMSALSAAGTKSALGNIANTPNVDPNQVYTQSLNASNTALPGAQQLTGQENQFNTAQMQAALNASVPGYSAIQSGRSNQIQSELAGQLPPDVQAAVERAGAAQGLSGGYGGSPAGRDLTARDLGQTSLSLMNLGQQQGQQLISGTPLASPISIAQNLGLNPSTLYSGDISQRTGNMAAATNAAVAPGALGTLGATTGVIGGSFLGSGLGTLGQNPGATVNPAGASAFNGIDTSGPLMTGGY